MEHTETSNDLLAKNFDLTKSMLFKSALKTKQIAQEARNSELRLNGQFRRFQKRHIVMFPKKSRHTK